MGIKQGWKANSLKTIEFDKNRSDTPTLWYSFISHYYMYCNGIEKDFLALSAAKLPTCKN